MGIFAKYKEEGATEGLYSDDRAGKKFGPKIWFDCEATYILKVERLVTGISKDKKKNAGQPFCAGNFGVLKIVSKEDKESRIHEGMDHGISYHKWLPMQANPEYMSIADELNLAEVLELLAAILKLKESDEEGNPYVDLEIADKLTADEGARVRGRVVGVDVVASPGKELDADGNPKVIFYNATWFAVEQNELGEYKRIEGYTPEELKARNVAAAQ